MSCLYILDINTLLIISSANSIFSHSADCLFLLLMVSFAVQKLLSLVRSHLFIFTFISFALEERSKKILLRFMSKSVLPMFSSRSLIHFEFFFLINFILFLAALGLCCCAPAFFSCG